MKTIITTLVSQQIKTNLQTEADTKGITLSKLVYKILKQYEQTNLSSETTKVTQKSNNAIGTAKTSTRKTKSI
jgi:molybdopterin converting factor small subunit